MTIIEILLAVIIEPITYLFTQLTMWPFNPEETQALAMVSVAACVIFVAYSFLKFYAHNCYRR